MSNKDWDPDLYLKFGKERIQPAVDLVSRMHIDNPARIIDIGCGPGNSTQVLARKWPMAAVTGVDNSPAMIAKAKRDYPNQEWRMLDAGADEITGKYDVVFSNATIQWIPDHAALLAKFHGILPEKGLIAVQLPLFWDMPIGKAIAQIASNSRWDSVASGAAELITTHDYSFYYDNLSALYHSIDIWESDYIHTFDSRRSILEMIRSTGLRPYLDRLESSEDRGYFEGLVLKEIGKYYPLQRDGKVLFPFKRLFFTARK